MINREMMTDIWNICETHSLNSIFNKKGFGVPVIGGKTPETVGCSDYDEDDGFVDL